MTEKPHTLITFNIKTILVLSVAQILLGCTSVLSNTHYDDLYVASIAGNPLCPTVPTMIDSLVFANDGQRLYASDSESNRILVISPSSGIVENIVETSGPTRGLAISSDGQYVYAGTTGAGLLSIIDTKTNKVTESIKLGFPYPQNVALRPDEAVVYVSSRDSEKIAIIDIHKKSKIADIPFQQYFIGESGLNPNNLSRTKGSPFLISRGSVSPDGSLFASVNGGGIDFFDLQKQAHIASTKIDGDPDWAIFSPDGNRLFVKRKVRTKEKKRNTVFISSISSIDVINVDTFEIEGSFQPANPFGSGAFSPDGSKFYIAQAEVIPDPKKYLVSVSILGIDTRTLAVSDKILIPVPKNQNTCM